jgi:tripartite-type tricarboxylate transporter receptor subunit TctC
MKLPYRRQFLQLAAGAAALPVVSRVARAQTYPSRPVTMIVPYPPGGPTDTLARIFAERMRASLGQPVIIENVGGAAGTIGVARAVRAAPDGLTVNFGNVASHVFSSIVYKLQYDVLTDLEPVALMTVSPMWILGSNNTPAKDLQELVAWLKASPDKATWGIVGAGSPAHLCGVYFQRTTGTSFQFVPYRGAGPVNQDLVGGQLNLSCLEASASRPNVASGNIRAYALLTENRWAPSPDVPTVDQAGGAGPLSAVLARAVGAQGDAFRRGRQAQRRCRRGVGGSSVSRPPERSWCRDPGARAAVAGGFARLPPGRNRQVAADHRGGQHQARVSQSRHSIPFRYAAPCMATVKVRGSSGPNIYSVANSVSASSRSR